LIYDEIGYLPIDGQGADRFFQHANAILDRLLHHFDYAQHERQQFQAQGKAQGHLKSKLDSPADI
jgi:hypothetical protein